MGHNRPQKQLPRASLSGPRSLFRSQAGSSLLLAVGFVAGIGIIVVALLGYASSNVKSEKAFRKQRDTHYAADQAIETAIEWARDQPTVATDPAVTTPSPCVTK